MDKSQRLKIQKYCSTGGTNSMESHSMKKVLSMEHFSLY